MQNMGPIVAQVSFQLSRMNSMVTMVTKLDPSWSQADWCKIIHLASFNVRHIRMIELRDEILWR
jgi:hypothetical protein